MIGIKRSNNDVRGKEPVVKNYFDDYDTYSIYRVAEFCGEKDIDKFLKKIRSTQLALWSNYFSKKDKNLYDIMHAAVKNAVNELLAPKK